MNYIRKADAPFVLNNASCMDFPACVCMHASAPFPYASHSSYVGLHGFYWAGNVIFEPWPHSGWCHLECSITRKSNKKLRGKGMKKATVHYIALPSCVLCHRLSIKSDWLPIFVLHALNIYDCKLLWWFIPPGANPYKNTAIIHEFTHTYSGTYKP